MPSSKKYNKTPVGAFDFAPTGVRFISTECEPKQKQPQQNKSLRLILYVFYSLIFLTVSMT